MYSRRACTQTVLLFSRSLRNNTNSTFRHVLLNQISPTSVKLIPNIISRFYSKNIEREGKLVYYGVLTPQIKAVKIFSLSSSIVGIIAQPFLYHGIASTGNVPVILACYSFIGFFTVVTPILLHLITKKYITHLEYLEDKDSYIARTVNFFCIPKKTEFKVDDVTVPDVPGMFTTFITKGKSLFIDPKFFEHPEHYARIMGYDKPIDFKLYENSSKDSSNK